MQKVLVIRLSAMGDVAMTSPIIYSLCSQYPNTEFTLLSTPLFEPFFAKFSNFKFIGTDIKKSNNGIIGLFKLYRLLTADNEYDAVFDIHDVLRTKILRTFFKLSGKRVFVIDKGRAEKKSLTRADNKINRPLKTTIQRYCDVFAKAGFNIRLNGHPLKKIELTDSLQSIVGERNGRWIGVSPFAQHRGKIYPLEKMGRVIEQLCSKPDISVLVFGGGEYEKVVAEAWEKQFTNCHSIIGKVRLRDELAIISQLDCMISMDSSAMHMSSLFGVRVVSVWGATHPNAGFFGYNQDISDAVQLNLPCRPCSIYGNKPCQYGNFKCMEIPPEAIVNRVLKE